MTRQRIYYTGDQANEPGRGWAEPEPDRPTLLRVTLQDGRVFRLVPVHSLEPGPGRRFVPWEEHVQARQAAIERMHALIARAQ